MLKECGQRRAEGGRKVAERAVFDREGFPSAVGPVAFLGLALLSQTASSFVQQGIPVLGVFLQRRFHLSLAEMGMTVSAATLGMMACFAVAGALADRLGPRRLMFWGSLGMALTAAAAAQVAGLAGLVLTLFLFGATLAAGPSAGMKAVFTAFAGRARGLPMGIRQTGVPLGAALAAFFLPELTGVLGWKRMFEGFALMLLVIGWGFSRAIPAWPVAAKAAAGARPRMIVWPLLAPMAVAFLMAAGQYDLLTFSIPDLVQRGHVGVSTAGAILAAAQVGGGAGRIAFGWWSDRQGGNRPRLILVCAALGIVGALAAALGPGRLPTWALAPLWFVFGIGAVGWNALVATWAAERVEGAHSGLAMSVTATSVFVGAVVNPPLFGGVVDRFHQFYWGWIGLAAILSAAAAILWRATHGARQAADAAWSHLSS